VDGSAPRQPGHFAELLGDLGWKVETTQPAPGRPVQLDVVVDAL
jgi:hypothetical protein